MDFPLIIRARSVKKLSGELVKLLGAKFDMVYETWTSRLYASDREYFAAPLSEQGDHTLMLRPIRLRLD